jgi:hypothetical protein
MSCDKGNSQPGANSWDGFQLSDLFGNPLGTALLCFQVENGSPPWRKPEEVTCFRGSPLTQGGVSLPAKGGTMLS